MQRADGRGQAARVTTPEQDAEHIPEAWRPDSDTFSYSVLTATGASLWTRSLEDGHPIRFGELQAPTPFNSTFSPDGRWIAYTQRGDGASVVVEPFPHTAGGGRYPIGRRDDLGHHPLFSRDGTQLFYFPGGGPLMSVTVSTSRGFTTSEPVVVPGTFLSNTTPLDPHHHDIGPDGRMVAALDISEGAGSDDREIRVDINWLEELTQRVPR